MIRRIRKTSVQREEIVADIVFLFVSYVIAVLALYVFDIHWNFYPDGKLFPPEKFVFSDRSIYLWGGLGGSIIGFLLIKLFLFGVKEEDRIWSKGDSR